MNIDKIKIPKDLMENVENKLRKHVENKKRRLHIYAAVAAISMALILPVSVYAYSKYYNKIPFKQEIDLARQNNNITKVNKTFKYKNVEFKIKEVIADETGMEVIYDVSNPKYSIYGLSFSDANNKSFKSWGHSLPNLNLDEKEKAIYITFGRDEAKYMKNNPINLNFDKISYKINEGNNKLMNKINSFIGIKDDSFKVDWNLKMKVQMQEMKIIPINKEYNLNVGNLKIKLLQEGVLKTILNYDFVRSDENIAEIRPLFSTRVDKEYISAARNDEQYITSSMNLGVEEFKSIYYKKINEIGIRLVGINVGYSFQGTKEYEVSKDKIPMEVEFNGEKVKVSSMVEKENSIEYTVEFCKDNKIYDDIDVIFLSDGCGSIRESGKVRFKDQDERNEIYNNLLKNVPDLDSIYNKGVHWGVGIDKAVVSEKFTKKDKKVSKFRVQGGSRTFLYDIDEIIIKP